MEENRGTNKISISYELNRALATMFVRSEFNKYRFRENILRENSDISRFIR